MLRAVVFDDEYIVLEGLRTMIDWSSYGIKLAGTASDGITALACFRELMPDIVFTDIRMPGMTGLQLIEKITELKPDTYCIVFSGFNEFEYVRNAIRLGVLDYLEKPISIASIEQALAKVRQHVEAKRERESLKRQLQDTQHEMLSQLTLAILSGDREELPRWLQLLGSDSARIAGVTVVKCDSSTELPELPDCRVILARNGDERLALVVHWAQPDTGWRDWLSSQAKAANIGIGGTYPIIEQAPDSYREAQRAYAASTNDPNKHEAIERAKVYIEQHFAKDLSLNDVAEYVQMNATYLSVLFKEAAGESYIKYLTRLRMEHAKALLQAGAKVNDVSEQVGYRTYRHFAEVFKKYTGQTPGQYKEDY